MDAIIILLSLAGAASFGALLMALFASRAWDKGLVAGTDAQHAVDRQDWLAERDAWETERAELRDEIKRVEQDREREHARHQALMESPVAHRPLVEVATEIGAALAVVRGNGGTAA